MTIAMRVVDTSAWIEWLTGSQLGKRLTTQFPDKPQFVVPTIVELELSKWLMREIGEERADQVLAYTLKCAVVPLDTTSLACCRPAPGTQAGHRGCHRLRHCAKPAGAASDV